MAEKSTFRCVVSWSVVRSMHPEWLCSPDTARTRTNSTTTEVCIARRRKWLYNWLLSKRNHQVREYCFIYKPWWWEKLTSTMLEGENCWLWKIDESSINKSTQKDSIPIPEVSRRQPPATVSSDHGYSTMTERNTADGSDCCATSG